MICIFSYSIRKRQNRDRVTKPVFAYYTQGDEFLQEVTMSSSTWRVLSNICFVAGFVSVFASIAIWFLSKESDRAHGERFGIFVGLWAPTFFALASRLDQYAAAQVTGS